MKNKFKYIVVFKGRNHKGLKNFYSKAGYVNQSEMIAKLFSDIRNDIVCTFKIKPKDATIR